MKITERSLTDEQMEQNDYRGGYEIDVKFDNKEKPVKFSFWDGEPEDANMGRDFSDVFSIVEAITRAYEAGKAGETLEMSEEEIDF